MQEQTQEKFTLTDVNDQIEAANEFIERKAAVERLLKNKDFINVFEKGLYDEELKRLASLLASQTNSERIAAIQRDIYMVGAVQYYLNSVVQSGQSAENHQNEMQHIANNPEEYADVLADEAE